ncbi:hypothetical protein ACH5RR_034208 [Cinchona calisaya]|uniref:Uncharacterized protein n=1 Tax=Cinchona calisaya TaxID=153742 RepID=A0ABD2YD94_9GENT
MIGERLACSAFNSLAKWAGNVLWAYELGVSPSISRSPSAMLPLPTAMSHQAVSNPFYVHGLTGHSKAWPMTNCQDLGLLGIRFDDFQNPDRIAVARHVKEKMSLSHL